MQISPKSLTNSDRGSGWRVFLGAGKRGRSFFLLGVPYGLTRGAGNKSRWFFSCGCRFVLGCSLTCAILLPGFSQAATIDVFIGVDPVGSQLCSLRDAIETINSQDPGTSGCDVVGLFGVDDQINLVGANVEFSGPPPIISRSLTLEANGRWITQSLAYRVLNVGAGGASSPIDVVIRNVTVRSGFATHVAQPRAGYGGGILVEDNAHLTMVDSTVVFNRAYYGGGIASFGDLTLIGGATEQNSNPGAAGIPRGGGGIFLDGGHLSLVGHSMWGNSASFYHGGGLHLTGSCSFDIQESDVHNNGAAGDGGGIFIGSGCSGILKSSTVRNNEAGGSGGGVYSVGTLDILDDSQIHANEAQGSGGGVFLAGGITQVLDSMLFDNHADSGGGIHLEAGSLEIMNVTLDANSCTGLGGAVWMTGGILSLDQSLVSNNVADSGGGIAQTGGVSLLTNSTLHGNGAGFNGNGGAIFSGGDADLEAIHITATANEAFNSVGGLHATAGSSVVLVNSILAASTIDCSNSGSATVSATSDAIIESDQCGTDSTNTDPMLGLLADNGGPTLSVLPLDGSPAINNASHSACLPVDQRSYARSDSECDIGAIEVGALPIGVIFKDGLEDR